MFAAESWGEGPELQSEVFSPAQANSVGEGKGRVELECMRVGRRERQRAIERGHWRGQGLKHPL